MLSVSSEPWKDEQPSLPASPFPPPVSGTLMLSLSLSPPSSPGHPTTPGVDLFHPQAAPHLQGELLLLIAVLEDAQRGAFALGWSQQPPLHPSINSE